MVCKQTSKADISFIIGIFFRLIEAIFHIHLLKKRVKNYKKLLLFIHRGSNLTTSHTNQLNLLGLLQVMLQMDHIIDQLILRTGLLIGREVIFHLLQPFMSHQMIKKRKEKQLDVSIASKRSKFLMIKKVYQTVTINKFP